MVLRRADPRDIPRLIDMTEMLVRAVDGPLNVERDIAGATFAHLMSRADAAIWLSDGGFLAASIETTSISRQRIAMEHGWFASDGSGLRLLRCFLKWADAQGAMPRLSTGIEGLDLSRLGFRPVEIAWVK